MLNTFLAKTNLVEMKKAAYSAALIYILGLVRELLSAIMVFVSGKRLACNYNTQHRTKQPRNTQRRLVVMFIDLRLLMPMNNYSVFHTRIFLINV